MSEPLYFQKHVFFCMNQRDDGRPAAPITAHKLHRNTPNAASNKWI
jgi:hypothetical protein